MIAPSKVKEVMVALIIWSITIAVAVFATKALGASSRNMECYNNEAIMLNVFKQRVSGVKVEDIKKMYMEHQFPLIDHTYKVDPDLEKAYIRKSLEACLNFN